MKDPLQVMVVTPEATPFARLGEVADVTASLCKSLARLGAGVSLIMPRYRTAEIDGAPKDLAAELIVPVGGERIKTSVWRSAAGKFPVYFVDAPRYFYREEIYGPANNNYLDNDERFVFFARAVCEFFARSRTPIDVVHCHNWPSALVPVFFRTRYERRAGFRRAAVVLTIHNAKFQGDFPPEALALTGLNWDFFHTGKFDFDGRFNFLKAGILYADAGNTVSRVYRSEMLSGVNGPNMSGALRAGLPFTAIPNGIDAEEWDPAADPFIAADYGLQDLAGKRACREDLLREFGLRLDDGGLLVGIVSRLTRDKGFLLLDKAAPALMARGLGLAVLGRGEPECEDMFRRLAEAYPGRAAVRFETADALRHKVIAGADAFLLPSLHEPGGLGPLYALRYGTVPIVRATGGLAESVHPFDPGSGVGDGFHFDEYSADALTAALSRALDERARPEVWDRLVRNGMNRDLSMNRTARRYVRLYRKTLQQRRGEHHVR